MERQQPQEKKNRQYLIGGIAFGASLISTAITINEHRDSIHQFIDNTIGTENNNSADLRPSRIEIPSIEDSYLEKILKSKIDPKVKYPETFLYLETISLAQVKMLENYICEPYEQFHIIIKDPSVLTPDVRNALRPYFDDREGDPTKNFTFHGSEI
jgi:hypothetical protein